MIGIIGAMDEEVALLKKEMSAPTVTAYAGMEFYQGMIADKDVVVVRSGIGKVNAAVCTQILIDKFGVTGLINTGIAGSLKNEIDIGDIVLSTECLEHDMDATNFGYPLGQIPRMDTLTFEADATLRAQAKAACKEALPDISVFEGRVVSGDQFISDSAKKDWLIEKFAGFCTEMEGAAIAHVAYVNQIPYLVIRAISDKADNSASMDYPAFEAMAIANSVKLLCTMLAKL